MNLREVTVNLTDSQKEMTLRYLPAHVRLGIDHSILVRYYPKIYDIMNYREITFPWRAQWLKLFAALIFTVFVALPGLACLHAYLHRPLYRPLPKYLPGKSKRQGEQKQLRKKSSGRSLFKAIISSCHSQFPFLLLFLLLFISSLPVTLSRGVSDVADAWLGGWWAENFARYGFLQGYVETGDNTPPFAFWLLGLLRLIAGDSYTRLHLLYKVSLIIFGLFACGQIFFLAKYYTRGQKSVQIYFPWLLAMFGYLSLVLPISHGYQDIYYMPFLLASFHALARNRFFVASMHFFLAVSWKWQPLLLLPFYLVYLINRLCSQRLLHRWYRSSLTWQAILPIILGFTSFTLLLGIDYPLNLVKIFMRHGSLNYDAINLSWLASYLQQFQEILITVGKWLFIVIFILLILNFLLCNKIYTKIKCKKDLNLKHFVEHSVLFILAYFLFNTGIHQNHLLIAYPLLLILPIFSFSSGVIRLKYLPFALFWLLYQNTILWYYNSSEIDPIVYIFIIILSEIDPIVYTFIIVLSIGYFLGYFYDMLRKRAY
ncbi:hypothetical protein P0082_02805 [Candidatus Haliotispira prima]|uniref:Glycosyltransferase RgtA/B/C/D-like domain-containing protein n=1 Tax=Candidatus Haliotispira prima TaxID=3034016 RepID=A0ABY8MKC0_9SPIO|nr:hypothetical protein P0082_02805 [Candidatus Haliotispira prima]